LAIVLTLGLCACGSRSASSSRPSAAPVAEPPAALATVGTAPLNLPEGEGRLVVQTQCMACHSADLLRQQRLTEAQWSAAIDKMVRWGVPLGDDQKSIALAYLSAHFGPANASYAPLEIEAIDEGPVR
jgi:hypothetical protein